MDIPGIRWMFPRTGIVGGPASLLSIPHSHVAYRAEEVTPFRTCEAYVRAPLHAV